MYTEIRQSPEKWNQLIQPQAQLAILLFFSVWIYSKKKKKKEKNTEEKVMRVVNLDVFPEGCIDLDAVGTSGDDTGSVL